MIDGSNDRVEVVDLQKKRVRTNCMFQEKLGLKGDRRMGDLLTMERPYDYYEGKILAEEVERNGGSEYWTSNRQTGIDYNLHCND